jgi:hypothetical protein
MCSKLQAASCTQHIQRERHMLKLSRKKRELVNQSHMPPEAGAQESKSPGGYCSFTSLFTMLSLSSSNRCCNSAASVYLSGTPHLHHALQHSCCQAFPGRSFPLAHSFCVSICTFVPASATVSSSLRWMHASRRVVALRCFLKTCS